MFYPAKQLTTIPLSVSQFFEKSFFSVPANQRLYRWGENQWKKLWDDLLTTLEEDFEETGSELISSQKAVGHFLGAVVLIGKDSCHPGDRWAIIDGQQRLTTLTILASCLSQFLDVISETRTRKRLDVVLSEIFLSSSANYEPRVKLNRDDEFYYKSINENLEWEGKLKYWESEFNGNSEVQSNVKDCFFYFYNQIKSFVDGEEDKSTYVSSLIDALSQNMYLLQVKAENTELAYRLFETLNERGLGLTQADLIRNKLIEYAAEDGPQKEEKVVMKWGELLDSYEDQSQAMLELPQLIQFSYSSRYEMVKKDKIFEKVSRGLDEGRFNSIELISQFSKDAFLWSSFLQGNLSRWTSKMSFSQSAILGPVWKEHCTPFLISVMDKYEEDTALVERSFMLLENYLFREGVVNKKTVSALQGDLTKLSKLVRADVDFSDVEEFFKKQSPDNVFVENFKTYSPRNTKQAFYVIYKIEQYNLEDVGFSPDPQSIAQHLEHIMPKKPGADWDGIDQYEEFSSYLNRLGNLMILEGDINRSVKNKALSDKITSNGTKGYADSGLTLPKELISKRNDWYHSGIWGFESINERQKYLAEKYALSVWAL
ncbi:DUF262 domain-containing protein [Bacterioplanoides sp. SCSIO 12839]|uniref:DUF262 domain-containing protein n=1 Tax=Bacterioplanoides sp. SCSIO 12839 TaxID=2829569 RepID=UPI002105BF29|nr:DUF262 domain-containing protein [Bacterioplanoides sp. SCSIO 12839]UTW49824.1 DUF262 domain-containing protein [Bacterioplanoides sp. SCSIO 12839]